MARIKVYSVRPYFNNDGHYIDIDGKPTFDPKHPGTYPGAEVKAIETITAEEFISRYGARGYYRDDILYTSRGRLVTLWEKTGRTSVQAIYGNDVVSF